MDRLSVPERLRIARQRKGWTQDELARALGVDKSTVSRHESGRVKAIDVEYVLRVARVVGADPRWIIGPANVGDAVNEAETEYGDLSPRERALVERWRFLGEVDRRYIEGFIAGRVGDEEEDLP